MVMSADQQSDMRQIFQAVLDVATQSLSVKLTQAALEISAASGDSIYIYPLEIVPAKTTVPNGTATGTIVVPAFACVGMKVFNLVTNTTVDLTATTPLVTLEWSPSDTDNVWLTTGVTATPATLASTGAVAGTAVTSSLARRLRVKFSQAAYSAGSFDVYVLGRG